MKIASILLVLAVITGAARGALEGGCGRAGALRCDADGRHVSACTRGGAWRRVLDCGASHGACVDGRCAGTASASARVVKCTTPGQWGCSDDCQSITICTTNNVWVPVSPCLSDNICVNGECVDSATNTCGYSYVPICAEGSVGHHFPDVNNCSRQLFCFGEGEAPFVMESCTNDPDIYYHPCSVSCESTSRFCDLYERCNGNEGLHAVIPGNPTLHYICANRTMFLMKCLSPTSKYDPLIGECIEIDMQCCPTSRLDINSSSNFVTFDDCEFTSGSSTESSTAESSTAESSTAESSTAESSTAESSTAESSTAESSTAESSTAESSTAESSTAESSTAESSTAEISTTTDGPTSPSPPCIVGNKWEDPGNVCKYYYCYPPGVVVHMSCPANSKYDAAVASCVTASGYCLR